MQLTYNPANSRPFWHAITAILTVLLCIWIAINYFDKNLRLARQAVTSDQSIKSTIGSVSSTWVYKLRYFEASGNQDSCAAEYFMLAIGENGTESIRVKVCEPRDQKQFVISIR
jgi:hypothetical protein